MAYFMHAGCPLGFHDLSSINGGCYKVVEENLAWFWAGLWCQSLHEDAHLLAINDAAEQSIVGRWLYSMSSVIVRGQ